MDDSLRNLSSDIVIISIALVGVSFFLIALVWKRFVSTFMTLSIYWQRQYLKLTFFSFVIPILIPVGAYTIVGVYYPSLAQNSVILVMALIVAIFFVYFLVKAIRWIIDIIRRKKRKPTFKIKLDAKVMFCIQTMLCLVLSIFCTVIALLGSSSSALGIYIGQSQVEDFNWSRWLLNDGILFFILAVILIGYIYLFDIGPKPNRK